jgi:gliding motility-associated-like protein
VDSQLCQLDTIVNIYAPLPVTVAIEPVDTLIALGSSITLNTVISNFTTQTINSFTWTPSTGLSCNDCPAPVATPFQSTGYALTVNYGKNCNTTAYSKVNVKHGPEPYIPNAFTPNGDNVNDEFTVFGSALRTVAMTVYNRWGEKVYDSGDSQWASWDGTYKGSAQPTGVYVYFVELTYLDGQKKTKEGSLTLIR